MKVTELELTPEEAFDDQLFPGVLYRKLGLSSEDVYIKPVKRSIDARSKKVKVRLQYTVLPLGQKGAPISYEKDYPDVTNARRVVIVGAGPAGLFAAIRLIEAGYKPVVIERGKDVQSRRRDLAAINKDHLVNPDSNYCFGEGGAGTYSDGKLYTRSSKRGDINRILEILVAHGAKDDILYDAHPHIGTNKLPPLITAMRTTILAAGGEVLFNTRVVDFQIKGDKISGVMAADDTIIDGEAVILATGHSARDVYEFPCRRKAVGGYGKVRRP